LLLKRIINGFLIASFIVLVEWSSPFIWFLAVCGIAIFGNYELQKIIEEKKYHHSYRLITTFIILFLSASYVTATIPHTYENFSDNLLTLIIPDSARITQLEWKTNVTMSIVSLQNLILGLAFLMIIIVNLNHRPRVSIGDLSFAFTRILYLGFFPSYLILMRSMPSGKEFLLLLLIGGGLCDIIAYFTGKKFGKTPLLPEISPNKTVEGAIGGTLACVTSIIAGGVFLLNIAWYHALVLGLITAIISQMGDLIESLFKRDVGKKDSGDLIPGHGGILDRVDSYIFIAFPAYHYILYNIF